MFPDRAARSLKDLICWIPLLLSKASGINERDLGAKTLIGDNKWK